VHALLRAGVQPRRGQARRLPLCGAAAVGGELGSTARRLPRPTPALLATPRHPRPQVNKAEVVGDKVHLTVEPAKGGAPEVIEADVVLVSAGG
jgi:hypothetical protein